MSNDTFGELKGIYATLGFLFLATQQLVSAAKTIPLSEWPARLEALYQTWYGWMCQYIQATNPENPLHQAILIAGTPKASPVIRVVRQVSDVDECIWNAAGASRPPIITCEPRLKEEELGRLRNRAEAIQRALVMLPPIDFDTMRDEMAGEYAKLYRHFRGGPIQGAPVADISVDRGTHSIRIRQTVYTNLDEDAILIFDTVYEAFGKPVTGPQLQGLPQLKGARIDRILKKLPEELRSYITGKVGTGYCFKPPAL